MDWDPKFLEATLCPIGKERLLALIEQRAAFKFGIGEAAFGRRLAPAPVLAMAIGPDLLARQLVGVRQVQETKAVVMVEDAEMRCTSRFPEQTRHLTIR